MQWCQYLPTYQRFIACLYVLQSARAQLYKNEFVNSCGSVNIQNGTTLASAGVFVFNLTYVSVNAPYNCSLRFTVGEGKRLALTFQGELSFPVEHTATVDGDDVRYNCSGGHIALIDPISERTLTPVRSVCGTQITTTWQSFYTDGNEMIINVIIQNEEFNGSVMFDLKYVAYYDEPVDKSTCYLCEDLSSSGNSTPVCIDRRLKCDGVINCPHGYESEEEDAKSQNRKVDGCSDIKQHHRQNPKLSGQLICQYVEGTGPQCKFRCSPHGSVLIDYISVCDGFVDCPNGLDENEQFCIERQIDNGPFGPLSMADGVVTIISGIILIILFSICLYYCCCPPPPPMQKGHYSSNFNLNFHDGPTSSNNADGRASQIPRDNETVTISSL